jgi:hypothetical protein
MQGKGGWLWQRPHRCSGYLDGGYDTKKSNKFNHFDTYSSKSIYSVGLNSYRVNVGAAIDIP